MIVQACLSNEKVCKRILHQCRSLKLQNVVFTTVDLSNARESQFKYREGF